MPQKQTAFFQIWTAKEAYLKATGVGLGESLAGIEIKSLQEISRILKPKGLFICYHFPNKFSLIEKIVSYFPNKYSHPDLYTSQDIQAMCYKQGSRFRIKKIRFLPRIFGEIMLRRSSIRRLLLII
ncbi:4'-phosphopantetheinyl transferase superfamily protein, partial [Anaplasma marginale]|uniref:4'-phosphopantetheinyl transferase superfamily protein n=1 Tax=Anaplasma marginale TaxID=770 RepID=UPI001F522EBD